MNPITSTSSPTAGLVPLLAPRVPIMVRPATMDDLPFMDALQKQHNKALGYFPTQQFRGYIEMGGVLLAQGATGPVGYCISRDRYLKRDELGVIYQFCVVPGDQRKLVGASLIQAVFERAAYGCRLFCCWCAQDLDANYFWESLGFVPIAFRAGSTGKKRVHIFWQRRIVADDATAYWYPSQTNSGAIRADRIVFPIPPGVHWKDVQAIALPTAEGDAKALPMTREKKRKKPVAPPPPKLLTTASRSLRFGPPPAPAAPPEPVKPKSQRVEKPKVKIDPRYFAAARELRDRWLEQINTTPVLSQGKYDVSRALEGTAIAMSGTVADSKSALALPAPAAA